MKQETLLLNYLAKAIELSIMVWCYINGLPLYQIPIIIALFHLGYLISARLAILNLPIWASTGLYTLGGSLFLFGLCFKYTLLLIPGIIITSSFVIQMKDNVKALHPVSIKSKFAAKCLGMASGIIIGAHAQIILVSIFLGLPLIWVFVQFQRKGKDIKIHSVSAPLDFKNSLNWIQMFHHLHYFLFCYTFWALLKAINPRYFAPLFILGWIAYYFMEKYFRQEGKEFKLSVIGYGHVFSGLTIALMLTSSNNYTILFLWFATGFGGGTIYMLRHIKGKLQFQAFENWGHVIGCLFAGAIIYFIGSNTASLVFSVISAIAVSIISIVYNRKINS